MNPRRGEVWLIQFDPAIGDEIQKLRPAVVIADPAVGILKVRLVVPFTDWKVRYSDYPWVTPVDPSITNGLSKTSAADAYQCKSVSFERFHRKLGVLTASQLQEIVESVGLCIGL